MERPAVSWIEIARLLAAAPHAITEAEVLLDRYDAGELSGEALMEALRALAARH
jgi:hypothetical protein